MARTSSAAVILLLGDASNLGEGEHGDYGGSRDLTPFIDTASAVIDRVRTCATNKGITLSSTELELMERWLAAHFYVCSDQTYASKSTLGASASFHGRTDMRLDSSRYGQSALALDPSGCLAAIASGKRASGFWLGRAPSEQTDYVDRD